MIRYEKAYDGEEEKILDFANYVFSQAHRPHDFRTLLPKVYGEGRHFAPLHIVAHDEKDNLRAMVCCLPMNITMCNEQLHVGQVGTVSVHPYARGEGHMKQLMMLLDKQSKEMSLDILGLSGQRQRYNYFGFEYAGYSISYIVNRDNIRHALRNTITENYELVPINDASNPFCEYSYKLYASKAVCGARPREEYLNYARTWQSSLYAVVKNGDFCGSLVDSDWTQKTLNEVLLYNEADLGAVLKLWFSMNTECESVSLNVWPYESERIAILETISEEMSIIPTQMIKILNFEHVMRAAMKLNEMCRQLDDGQIILGIDSECFCIRVENGVSTVQKTDEKPGMMLTAMEAQRLLFLPTVSLIKSKSAFFNWLPLPWVMPSIDRF